MTVYVITKGDYSDYHICAVTLDKEKAEKLAKVYSSTYDEAMVEEYETDTEADEKLINGRIPYSVCFYENGKTFVIRKEYELSGFKEGVFEVRSNITRNMVLEVAVYAEDKNQALKIATDKRAKYLAEKAGIT